MRIEGLFVAIGVIIGLLACFFIFNNYFPADPAKVKEEVARSEEYKTYKKERELFKFCGDTKVWEWHQKYWIDSYDKSPAQEVRPGVC